MPLLHWENADIDGKNEILAGASQDEAQRWALARIVGGEELALLRRFRDESSKRFPDSSPLEPLWWTLSKRQVDELFFLAQRSEGREGCYDCAVCGVPTLFRGGVKKLEHVVSKADARLDDIFNHVLTCEECNDVKGDRYTLAGARKRIKDERKREVMESRALMSARNAARMRFMILHVDFVIEEHDTWVMKMELEDVLMKRFPTRGFDGRDDVGVSTPKGRRMHWAMLSMKRPIFGEYFIAHRCPQCLAFVGCECPFMMRAIRGVFLVCRVIDRLMLMRQWTIRWEVWLMWWWLLRKKSDKRLMRRLLWKR